MVAGNDFSNNSATITSAALSVTFPDDLTSLSYNILNTLDFLPEIEFTSEPPLSLTLNGVDSADIVASGFTLSADLLGQMTWSQGTSVLLDLLYENPTTGDFVDYIFILSGPDIPFGSTEDDFFAFLLTEFPELANPNLTEEEFDALLGTILTPATGAFAPGQDIPLTSIAWDSIVDNPDPIIEGTTGADTLTGTEGDDEINGLGGNDSLLGNGGNDSILGGFGFDTLDGGAGNDTLDGEGNADLILGGLGEDSLIGGVGTDRIEGGDDNDRIFGGDGADRLFGDDGDDLIRAGSNVGTSVDGVEGGAGNDTIFGEGGFDLLIGGTGNDSIDGGNQADDLRGEAGNDTLIGGNGFDRLFGGADDDLLQDFDGFGGMFGGTGNDTIQNGDAPVNIFGGQGNDLIEAGGGNDTIGGNAGFDTINAGTGDDLIFGDFNADIFVFESLHGNDTVADFDAFNALEQLDFSGVAGLTLAGLDLASATNGAATQVGGDVVIDTGGGNSVTLTGVSIGDLDAGDFIF